MKNNQFRSYLWLTLAGLLLGSNTVLACDEVTLGADGKLWCYQNCTWDAKRSVRRCDMSAVSVGGNQANADKETTPKELRAAVSEGRYVSPPLQREKQLLLATASVKQTSCNAQAVVSFDKLSSAERILMHTAADAFVYGEPPPEDAGCSVYDDGVECHAFGYVCWIDSDSSGCSKETC